ncbi:MAG: HAD-IA family hydrolase [Candidatus Competibacteraceae bacterium]|nr:HAD-IA family hydrolase [Candidatus Competibacteraceae bacterium]
MLSVRAITFDLDDTLWDIWPIIVRAEQRLHDWLALHYPLIPERFTALELRQICDEVSTTKPHIAHDRTLLRKEALGLAALRAGYADFQVDAAFEIFFAARNDVIFFEEVLSVLERLAQCYTLGALTNGNADIQLVGLNHVFDFAINAVAVGAAKPDPAMFEAACRHLNLPPEQILHVGDDPHHDVLGAAQVGLRTVWVNRTQRDWPGGQRADVEISTLEELEALLERC